MRAIHVWKMIQRIFRTWRSWRYRIVSSDLQRLNDYLLCDIGLEQHPGGRAEVWWRREITPAAEAEDLCK